MKILRNILFLTLFLISSRSVVMASPRYFAQLKGWLSIENNEMNYRYARWNAWFEDHVDEIPVFDSMLSMPLLPDPLNYLGKKITSGKEWRLQVARIQKLYQYYVSGTLPPAPDNIRAVILSKNVREGVTEELVELTFGPENKAHVTLELLIPHQSGKLPVFMTQWNHRQWAQIAVRRGYIGCVYAAADNKDDTWNYAALYPDYDFAMIMQRAWAASRVVDYIETRSEFDTNRIAITGHSRNSKQSIMAAAFDSRIDAVVASSGGTVGENAFRFSDNRYDNETIEKITRVFPQWFHPRLRLFVGREDKLPVDQNMILACIAPRPLMLTLGVHEFQIPAWGVEKVYESLLPVYEFHGKKENLLLRTRVGEHGTSARDIEDFIDFLDNAFGIKPFAMPNKRYYAFSFEQWKKEHPFFNNKNLNKLEVHSCKDLNEWKKMKAQALQYIQTLYLGKEPAGVLNNAPVSLVTRKFSDDHLSLLTGRPIFNNKNIGNMIIGPYHSAGDYLWANLYFPSKDAYMPDTSSGKMPLVIYLHEMNHSNGFSGRVIGPFVEEMVSRGIAVLAFDMVGFGTRMEEYQPFYYRYPDWTLMGKMVTDAGDMIQAASKISFIDSSQIFLCGYAIGGTVALLQAATSSSAIRGVISVNGFTPLRGHSSAVEGIDAFARLHGFMPALGLYSENSNDLPVDFNEIISCIAPRRLLLVNTLYNRHSEPERVDECVQEVKSIYSFYQAKGNVDYLKPDDYDRFSEDIIKQIGEWINLTSNPTK